jgi:predicted nucleic acid-binding protein
MAEALILDSEAVNALARPTERRVLAERAGAILRVAHRKRALIRVPAPVLAEVCRSVRHDLAINHLLNNPGVRVAELDRAAAQQAGQMLARLKLSSEHAIDAFVVAIALQFDTAVIATGDPEDMRRLAAPFSRIGVFAL